MRFVVLQTNAGEQTVNNPTTPSVAMTAPEWHVGTFFGRTRRRGVKSKTHPSSSQTQNDSWVIRTGNEPLSSRALDWLEAGCCGRSPRRREALGWSPGLSARKLAARDGLRPDRLAGSMINHDRGKAQSTNSKSSSRARPARLRELNARPLGATLRSAKQREGRAHRGEVGGRRASSLICRPL